MADPNAAAFPIPARISDHGSHYGGQEGLTVRQYFMAHAPTEPAKWFEPIVPSRPEVPKYPEGFTENQLFLIRDHNNGVVELGDIDDPEVLRYISEVIRFRGEVEAWEGAYVEQCAAQWPAAWADAVLKAGGYEDHEHVV